MPNDPQLSVLVRLKDKFTRQFQQMQKKTDQGASRMAKGFGHLKGMIVGAVAAYAGWVAVQKTWNAVKAYANLEAVERAFDNLRDRIGASKNAVVEWNKAVRNTIGYADLYKEANKAIISGAIQSEQEFTKLAEAAFFLSRSIGEEVLPTFQQLLMSLESGSPRAMRRFGMDMERLFYLEQQRTGTTGTLPLEVKQRMMVEALLKKSLDIQRDMTEQDRKHLTTLEKIQQAQVDYGDSQEEVGRAAKDMVEVMREWRTLQEQIAFKAAETVVTYKKLYDDFKKWHDSYIRANKATGQRDKNPVWDIFSAWLLNRMGGRVVELDEQGREVPGVKAIKKTATAGTAPKPAGALPDMVVTATPQFGMHDFARDMSIMRGHGGYKAPTYIQQTFEAMKRGTEEYVTFAIEGFRHFADATTQTFQSLENTIGTVFFDAMMGDMKRFKDYVASFVRDISQILSQMMARQLVGTAISGIGGLFTGSGGGAGSALFEGGVQQFAEGGIATRPSIVGESGPEAVIPLSRGRSVPVEMKGGGKAVSVNFHIRTNDAGSFRSSLVQNQEVISGIIKKALGNDMQLRSTVRAV